MLKFLKRVSLFSHFHDEDLSLLVDNSTFCQYDSGSLIVNEGEEGDEFYLILKGSVDVRKENQKLAELTVGQFFGEMALLDRECRSADVVAASPTECMVLSGNVLHSLIIEHPKLALKMLAELTRRLRNTDQESVADLEKRVSDRTRELSTLYEVTAVASASLELHETMERSLERVVTALGTDSGAIALLDEDVKTLQIEAFRGMPTELVDRINLFKEKQGIGAWIIEHGVPLVIFDISSDHRVPDELKHTVDPMAYVGVPMRARGKVLGVLGVGRDVRRQFSVEEVALIASIADQIGVAIANANLYGQAQQLAVIEERQRLARDLHDSVTQSIYSVTLFAEVARRMAAEGETLQAKDYIEQLGDTAQQALKELRLLVYELRPSLLEEEGLIAALQQRLSTVEQRAGVNGEIIAPDDLSLQKSIEAELYHIALEGLNNALKHAEADAVTILFEKSAERINMIIEDNGVGFDMDAIGDIQGMGMTSMKERSQRLGGSFEISSALNRGTRVQISIPKEHSL